MREVEVKAGQRIKVLGLGALLFTERIEFEVETADGTPPQGKIETAQKNGFTFRWKTETHTLEAVNTLEKPWFDPEYKVYITSEADALVRFRTRHFRIVHFVLLAAIAGAFILLVHGGI